MSGTFSSSIKHTDEVNPGKSHFLLLILRIKSTPITTERTQVKRSRQINENDFSAERQQGCGEVVDQYNGDDPLYFVHLIKVCVEDYFAGPANKDKNIFLSCPLWRESERVMEVLANGKSSLQ